MIWSIRPTYLLLAVLMVPAVRGDEPVGNDKLSEETKRIWESRREAIREEISSFGGHHPWAGEYHGVASLAIAPKNGFAFVSAGCVDVIDRNYGMVVPTEEGTLKLVFEYPHERGRFRAFASEFVPVRWGERRYLISPEEVVQFCNRNNSNREPRDRMDGLYFLRQGDHEVSRLPDAPSFPSTYQPFVLERPIDATIVTVHKTKIGSGPKGVVMHATQIELSAGREDGVVEEMHFRLLYPHVDVNCIGARVVTVERNSAIAMLTQIATERIPPAPPQLGWKMITGDRYTKTERCRRWAHGSHSRIVKRA